jgi:hypothetical protein
VLKLRNLLVLDSSRYVFTLSRDIEQPINVSSLFGMQSYLVSIRPFLRPKAGSSGPSNEPSVESTSSVRASHLSAPDGGSDSKSLVTSAQNDEIFSHGREIEVDWRMASWVTLRDQVGPMNSVARLPVLELIKATSQTALLTTRTGYDVGFLNNRYGNLVFRFACRTLPKVARRIRSGHGRTERQGRGWRSSRRDSKGRILERVC